MRRTLWIRGVAVLVLLSLTGAACDDVPLQDNTAPTVEFEAFGALHSLHFDSTAGGTAGTVRARSDDKVKITVTARDAESGIGRLHVSGNLDSVCIPASGNNLVSVREPVGEVVTASGSPEGLVVHRFVIDVAARRAACPASTRFYELKGELIATAENGKGAATALPAIGFRSFGPDMVSIATFNLYNPGNHPDSTYIRWGRELGSQANAVILTEVADLRRAKLFGDAAGLPHAYVYGDVAIVSEGPIRNIQKHTVDPPGNLTSADSNILSVQTDLGGFPHQIIGMHWGIRDAGDVSFPPNTSSPSRLVAAQKVLDFVDPSASVIFIGGDLNAYSGVGPQRVPGATAEVDLVRTMFTDPFISMNLTNDRLCTDQRIDYVMFRGPVTPARYSGCFSDSGPSDHPFVLTIFNAG